VTELELPVQGTASDCWQQKLVERLFSVCCLLTKDTPNRNESVAKSEL